MTRTDNCDIRFCRLSSTPITISKFNGRNYAQWPTEVALVAQQKQVIGIIEGYDDNPKEAAANVTATEKAAFKDWMDFHGVDR
jgi:hypothetical protein